MSRKNRIYITGHRNPDMDSICAALSYAVLKSITDPDGEYIPVRCGHLSDSLAKQLDFAGIKAPHYMRDIYPKVGDVMLRDNVTIEADSPLYDLVKVYTMSQPSAVPVFDKGSFYGLLSIDDITSWFLKDNSDPLPEYDFSIENIEKVITGRVVHRGERETFRASILAGAASLENFFEFVREWTDSVIVMGYRKGHLEHAMKMQVPAIIITAQKEEPDIDFSGYGGLVYVTSLGTAETIRRLRMSQAVSAIMGSQGTAVQATDLFDDVRDLLSSSKLRGIPVFDGEKWAGFVTRRCFLKKPSYSVILVDHNETGQSIRGIEEATVLEIIDHHRLNAPRTTTPIFIDAEPLGSACTIVYQNFLRRGLTPDSRTARTILTGIVCDTLILKSPTTTEVDITSAQALAKLCGIDDITAFGQKLFSFSESLAVRDPVTVINSDFKVYSENGLKLGIGQCEVPFLGNLDAFLSKYLEGLEAERARQHLDWAMLMVTDVLRGNSILLSSTSKYEKKLSYRPVAGHVFDMPQVLSRKKQLLPEILHAIS